MNRRTIAVCVTGYNWEYESRVVSGIYDRCVELDINLLAFSTVIRKPELNTARTLSENVIFGEAEIFNLINYDMLDGIIILGDSIIDEKIIYRIAERAKEHGIPTLNINDPEHKLDINVLLSDKIAMEFVMRHLVEDHGFTKINFIGGFPGNLQTEERLAAYKKILTEHNIPVEEKRISYGEFWKKAADCTENILNSGDIPQAIVCASDTMAFFCMDRIKEHGLKIPDDIVVTGFDGIKDCEIYTPTLTTVRRAFYESGIVAADALNDIFCGKEVPSEIEVNSVLVKHQSCGCDKISDYDNSDFCTARYGELNIFREFNTYILDMNTRFSNAESSLELFEEMNEGAEFFKLKRLYICISYDIEKSGGKFHRESDGGYIGISEKMVSMLKFGHDIPVGTEFPSAQLLPEDILHGEKCVFMSFSPIYFKDRFLGYLAYEPSKIKGYGDFFPIWLMALSNNLGSFYMKNELEFAVGQLRKLYIRDPLTGLYNRRGMDKESVVLIDKACGEKLYISVICADIDNLKPINDIFGHNAGDNAIIRTGEALRKSAPEGSVCTRTGGDEFCVICAHNNEDDVKKYIGDIEQRLTDYNAKSGLSYKIGCSCGSYTVKAEDFTDFEELLRNADADMYRVKAIRKANRA